MLVLTKKQHQKYWTKLNYHNEQIISRHPMVCFTTRDWLACRSVRLERCKSDSRQDIWWRHAEQLEAESDKRVAQFFVALPLEHEPPTCLLVHTMYHSLKLLQEWPFQKTFPFSSRKSEWEGWCWTKWHFCFLSPLEHSFSSPLCSREATSQKKISFPYWNCGEPLCWSTVQQGQRKAPKNYP